VNELTALDTRTRLPQMIPTTAFMIVLLIMVAKDKERILLRHLGHS